MHPYLSVLGKQIPTYWLCALAGAAAVSLLLFVRHKIYREIKQVDITNGVALAAVGMIIGGRILYVITILPLIIRNWSVVTQDLTVLRDLLSNGMVFYGGLFGAAAALVIYLKKYKIELGQFFDYFAPGFPLFHAFGRIGCFFTGCCHGIVSERFGIPYSESISSVNGIPYLPVQLIESGAELLLCVVVVVYSRRHHGSGKAFEVYLVLYAAIRFCLEFLRGDSIRGFVLGLSTSQWISILILAYAAVRKLICLRIKKSGA